MRWRSASPQLEHLLAYTTEQIVDDFLKQEKYKACDDPFGLFCGKSGRAWGWLVADGHCELGPLVTGRYEQR